MSANLQLSSETIKPYVDYAMSVIKPKSQTMTSLQVAEITGKQHSHVMRDIRNMVDNIRKVNESTSGLVGSEYHRGDRTQYKALSEQTQNIILNFAFGDNSSQYQIAESSYIDAKGESRAVYILNKKACLLLASGYDVILRAKIIDRWEELELKQREIPRTKSERTLATIRQLCELAEKDVELERKQLQLEQEQKVIALKISEIEDTIRPNGYMSVMGFANIHHINIGDKAANSIGRLVSKWCKRNNVKPEKIRHPRFGEINSYPMEALRLSFTEFYPEILF